MSSFINFLTTGKRTWFCMPYLVAERRQLQIKAFCRLKLLQTAWISRTYSLWLARQQIQYRCIWSIYNFRRSISKTSTNIWLRCYKCNSTWFKEALQRNVYQFNEFNNSNYSPYITNILNRAIVNWGFILFYDEKLGNSTITQRKKKIIYIETHKKRK